MSEDRIGPFKLEKILGRGGMGVVYRATYEKTGQKVAVKLLPPELSEDEKLGKRFDRELAILRKLQHPNIVQCYGGGKHQGRRFYAMELLPGGTLAHVLREKGRIPWEDVVEYGKQICTGLQHAHELGIIHRDLKPANLMLARNGTLKLADFGIARDASATALTAAGKTVGTYAYMSPEQIVGEGPPSHKSDLYSLGCVFFEMLTGRPPFVPSNPAEMFFCHLQKEPPRVSSVLNQTVTESVAECPIWLENLVADLLRKQPEDRPYDALAVSVLLDDVLKKVAAGESVARNVMTGQLSTLTGNADATGLRDLVKSKKRKKRRDNAPFYEQTWFLATGLLLVVAFATWMLWPLNEDQLYARARPLMSSENESDWRTAMEQYVQPMRERFPEGKYAAELQEFVDKVEMAKAEKVIATNARFGRDPGSEGERLYVQARNYEQFGDRIAALEKYEAMIRLLEKQPDQRPFMILARRQAAAITSSGGAGQEDREKIVSDAMSRADNLYKSGKTIDARKVWESIVSLYGENKELRPQVERARRRLDDKHDDADAPDDPSPGDRATRDRATRDRATRNNSQRDNSTRNNPPRKAKPTDSAPRTDDAGESPPEGQAPEDEDAAASDDEVP
jgi:serine/threonine-protein kinase